MKNPCFVIVLCFLMTPLLSCGQQRSVDKMDFEAYDPPSMLVVPEHKLSRAKFPFIDVHNHQFNMPSENLSSLVEDMEKLNMAVMVNLSGRGRGSTEHLKGALNNVKTNYPNAS